jgi:hypothetical protein
MTYADNSKREAPASSRREVYFVQSQSGGLIKIGVSKDAAKRIAFLRTSAPEPILAVGVMVCNEGGELERTLHRKFAHLRTHGEWFRPDAELWAFIDENALSDPERVCAINRQRGASAVGALLAGRTYRKQRIAQGLPVNEIPNEWDVVLIGRDERRTH